METLFICSANVGRSQIAEGYYNYFTKSQEATSAALIEDRREKYDYKPPENIVEIMREDGVDITNQRIKLLTPEMCNEADIIILLLNLNLEQETEFTIHGEKPTKFLLENYRDKLQIREIQDPFGETNDKLRIIRDEIKDLIKLLL